MAKIRYSLALAAFLISTITQAQGVLGQWKSIDDETGKAKSVVEIYERDGKIYGKIVQLFRAANEDQDPICVECTGKDKGKKIIGLEIIKGLSKDGNEYEDGTILDPENGKTYDCKIWVDKDKPTTLNVRGYVAFFYRTQYWQRFSN